MPSFRQLPKSLVSGRNTIDCPTNIRFINIHWVSILVYFGFNIYQGIQLITYIHTYIYININFISIFTPFISILYAFCIHFVSIYPYRSVKHGWLENPRTRRRCIAEKIWETHFDFGIFQQSMFSGAGEWKSILWMVAKSCTSNHW